jgi:AraC family transcriptional regulator
VAIYREMPPLWDRAFRERFYARWGRENAVISALSRRAEYPDYTQLLSVKMMSGGNEDYFVDGRRIRVDDDTYLILNAGRRYASRIDALQAAHSFSVFFRPALAADVRATLLRSPERLLADPAAEAGAPEFDERLREHDGCVSPVLRHIQRAVDAGEADELWLEEQLHFLIGRMLRLERRLQCAHELLPRAKPATRRELIRRIGLGVTFIHTHFREPLGLRDMARAAHLSPFHFLRSFKALHGVTPAAYLRRKRTRAAARLIGEGRFPLAQISELVGFGSRTTLFRQLRASRNI